jgi:polyribonucleotide nucleotidyltransferase
LKKPASPGCTFWPKWPRRSAAPAQGIEQIRAAHRGHPQINPEKIGALIGPGGKNIKRLVEESGCEINIEDDGTVNIFSVSAEGMKIAKDAITGMTAEAEIGKIYRGKVVTVKEFGAFVEFLPGKDGLVHISELANFRVKKTEDIVKVGDDITVKCLGVDEKGRVRLSRKAAMEDRDQEMAKKE